MEQVKRYDVIIIGGSYAGMAAGMALGRALRKVLIIDGNDPCNKQTPHSHNFLTNDGKTPTEIAGIARHQVAAYVTVEFINELATDINKKVKEFEVVVSSGEKFMGRKLVFATGVKDIMPTIPGFAECWGISVPHCPYCHGYEVRHQNTGLLANGDTAFEMSALLSNWTDQLTLFTNGTSTLTAVQRTKLESHHIIIDETAIERLEHTNGYLENIVFKNGRKIPLKALYTRLPFVQHCNIPQTLGCEITTEGFIKVDATHQTSVKGVYTCGDNVSRMRTVANAIAMGTSTGMMLNRELIDETFEHSWY